MKVIFCEECGGKNIVADEELEHIDNKPLGCRICGNIISAAFFAKNNQTHNSTVGCGEERTPTIMRRVGNVGVRRL
ncbi:MAG: hypothetical protein D3910_19380, partial [Candidatus Electrothrix sp. ATG2]|nr:hypothetical protein [Candidatus Electrothrix sp. ATG2]